MTVSLPRPSLRHAALAAACTLALAGCGTYEFTGEKIDYRTQGAQRERSLEVPPDLTQLSRDSRYQAPSSGTVSASTFQPGAPSGAPTTSAAPGGGTATAVAAVTAPKAIGDVRIERSGNQRWLVSSLTPEQLWPQIEAFWRDRGFALTTDDPQVGVMETAWAENRAKLPQDPIRRTIGKVFDNLWDTGERDKFRTRVERTASGTEVYITHAGMVEVYVSPAKDLTAWQPRPNDPGLEAEMLQRLMVKLGVKEDDAKTTVAATAAPAGAAARARLVADQPSPTLQVDDGFDRAWRRVGLALDRSGFTVEDRDRAQGVYFVRYVASDAKREQPGLLSRIFGGGDKAPPPARYRVTVKADGADRSRVSVLNAQGAAEGGEAAQRIVNLLLGELK